MHIEHFAIDMVERVMLWQWVKADTWRNRGLKSMKCIPRILPFLIVLAGQMALACSTPVYRYALERWPPDFYPLEVLHAEPLAPAVKQALDKVESATETNQPNAAVTIRKDGTLSGGKARLRVRFPNQKPGTPPMWDKPLTVEALNAVLTSPVREKTGRMLIDGVTAVWLFIPCGDKAKDALARATLERELKDLAAKLKLPEDPEAAEGEDGEPAEMLALSFPILTVDRTDPKEAFLLHMLLHMEPDLTELVEPMTFPVFGQGRALYAIVGRGINPDIITEACLFMTGACSCQVKAQNPGVDLMMTADWASATGFDYEEEELPPLSGISVGAPKTDEKDATPESVAKPVEEEPLPEPSVDGPPPSAPTPPSRLRMPLVVIGVIAVLVVLGSAAMLLRRRDD
ncbi:MAG: hypothetical protein KAI66_12250 [Lentisphaeria bacterium]|nr:hypothetical protein [Lentisphaeria bacterium]